MRLAENSPMTVRQQIRFDDIEGLRTAVNGEPGAWSVEVEIGQEMINRFAELTGDHQWLHVDVERCQRESPYKTTVAHGFLVLALIPSLKIPPPVEITGHKAVINYGADKLRFMRPVKSGARIHARMQLKGAERTDAGTRVAYEIAIHGVGQRLPAVLFDMLVLLT
jgi:acyl dehydratase